MRIDTIHQCRQRACTRLRVNRLAKAWQCILLAPNFQQAFQQQVGWEGVRGYNRWDASGLRGVAVVVRSEAAQLAGC